MDNVAAAVEHTYRTEQGAILATLIRMLGDFSVAEEALQEAFAVAAQVWTREGIPERPGAWILTTARRKAIDALRREGNALRRRREVALLARLEQEEGEDDVAPGEQAIIPDDQLRLIFTCCHPALSREAQVALTLRTLGGLGTTEVARALLVPEPTMAQRLVRAKHKIRGAGIPYRIPSEEDLPERLSSVLAVLYLIFNEGYFPSAGEAIVRAELCEQAIRLARGLVHVLPEPEAVGLLALMLLQHSRREARTDESAPMIALEDQDRTRWDRAAITDAIEILEHALRLGRPGPFQIQASVAAVHAEAGRYEETDWRQIVELYATLARHQPSPVVELNRAAAIAMADGPAAGLALVDRLAAVPRMQTYQPFHATRADLLRRLGRMAEAAGAYRRAIELTKNHAAQKFLSGRLHEVESG